MINIHKLKFLKVFGPGILFAGAAIGNSHLVQSTRAGAMYGLGLLVIVIFANIIKYPAFRFGPYYAAVTGRSLIEGYRSLGRPVVLLVALSELAVQAIIIAGTAITTAGITLAVLGIDYDARIVATASIILGGLILSVGGYPILDKLAKIFVAILTITTFVVTIIIIPKITLDFNWHGTFFEGGFTTFFFIVALMGFMPAALNLSILHSLWAVAKTKLSGNEPSLKDVMLDFNIGYLGSAILAICFLLMGAAVMHGNEVEPANAAVPFARQIITLYTTSLGGWSGIVVGVSAMAVMFTTLLTVLDGMPRMQAAAIKSMLDPNGRVEGPLDGTIIFYSMMALLSSAAIMILFFFMTNFKEFIDFVTTTAFIVAPITALLNHIVVHGPDIPKEMQPSRSMRLWSLFSIIILTMITAVYFITVVNGWE